MVGGELLRRAAGPSGGFVRVRNQAVCVKPLRFQGAYVFTAESSDEIVGFFVLSTKKAFTKTALVIRGQLRVASIWNAWEGSFVVT